MDQRSGFPRADRAGDARPIGRHWNLRPPACPLSLAASFARAARDVGRGREQDRGRAQDRHGARRNSQRRTPTPRWPVAGVRSGNKLKAGHGEPTEPGQRVIAVALVDVHHLVDLADDEDVASQGVVDAAYKAGRHGSPRVFGARSTSQHRRVAVRLRVRPAGRPTRKRACLAATPWQAAQARSFSLRHRQLRAPRRG